jgi:hypothetical protein
MIRIDTTRWNQTAEDLRKLALESPHPRTRERFQALYEIARNASAFAWSKVTGRRHSTILDWIRLYNDKGPSAMTYKRTGARKPLFLRSATSLAT